MKNAAFDVDTIATGSAARALSLDRTNVLTELPGEEGEEQPTGHKIKWHAENGREGTATM